jgi:hypothetical protein
MLNDMLSRVFEFLPQGISFFLFVSGLEPWSGSCTVSFEVQPAWCRARLMPAQPAQQDQEYHQ